jgi:hypothetical protein
MYIMTDISGKKPRRVTLKMIAEQTGFTINTVSHALNGKSDISARTTEIIKRKAQEMGYINDMTASALRSGFTKTIALILPNVANPFWAVLIKGINLELYRAGYTSLIMDTDENSHLEYRAVQSAISRKVDGIIIVFILKLCIIADRGLFIQPLLNNLLQVRKSAATDKQNISRIYRCQRHHRIFAVRTDRHLYLCALQKP